MQHRVLPSSPPSSWLTSILIASDVWPGWWEATDGSEPFAAAAERLARKLYAAAGLHKGERVCVSSKKTLRSPVA